ncbi:MAG: IMP cyclohydrolase [Planctomycetota bacterium]|jgi:IMP cyclohydrolase|nr:IMP cyclohydrolase [Planctomycetota bacterium]
MQEIYLGRIVAIALTPSGKPALLYRISSRSFPNRRAEISTAGDIVTIVPNPGHESDIRKNPYISYNCVRILGTNAVFTNGSHTDPIADKMTLGLPARDAIVLSLLALDYEKDSYATPRIAAVCESSRGLGWLGIVRQDGLDVRSFPLEAGKAIHLSTYSHNIPTRHRQSDFGVETPEEACELAISGGVFRYFTHPVTAVAAVWETDSFRLAVKDASPCL